MKKKILYTLIGLAVLLLTVYLLRYNQSQVFEHRVPKSATKVVNVHLRQIENNLLFDFLAHPIIYLKSKPRKDSLKRKKFPFTNGVEIPENILFFSNATSLDNHWFSNVFNVKDQENLTSYFLQEKFVKSNIEGMEFYSKDNWVIALRENKLIQVIKRNHTADISKIVVSVFNEKAFLPQTSELLKPIILNESDISFSSKEHDFLEANFKEGVFEITGNFDSDFFIADTYHDIKGNPISFLTAKVNKHNLLFENFISSTTDKFNGLTHLSLDSIVNKWNGKFYLKIDAIENKIDSIITYDYDDDFNKVEKIAIEKKNIPNLNIKIGQEKPSNLWMYFWSKNAIQFHKGDTVFTTIPIYQFMATDANENLELSVNSSIDQIHSKEISSKLNFYVDVEKYLQKPLDIPLKPNQIKVLDLIGKFSIHWSENNEFLLNIELKNKDRNFLGQLIKH